MIPQLLRTRVRERAHVALRPELQTAGGTRFDARGLESLTDAVRTQGALVDLLRRAVELRDVEGTARDAVLAPDAVFLLKIDDAIGVLNDRAVRRTCAQAPGILAVHALVLAHQPHLRAVVALMLVELDQVPVVPLSGRHRLVRVVEGGLLERHVVPFDARDFAGLAADAGRHVDVLADFFFALHAAARNAAGMRRDGSDLKHAGRHDAPPKPSRASPGSPWIRACMRWDRPRLATA